MDKKSIFFPLFFLFTISTMLYVWTIGYDWTYDDFVVVVNNSDIRSFSEFFKNNYPGRPLRELSYMLDYFLFGLEPAGYHFQQIFWHGMCGVLVYVLFLELDVEPTVAWISALIFLLHPLQVESVANVGHRKELLAGFFSLASLFVYIKGLGREKKAFFIVSSFLLFIFGVFSKQNVVLLPVVLVLYELGFVEQENRFLSKHLSVRKLYIGAGVAAFVVWLYFFDMNRFKGNILGLAEKLPLDGIMSIERYYYTILKAASFNFSKIVFPIGLTPEYSYEILKNPFDLYVILTPLLLVSLSLVFIKSFSRNKGIFVGCLIVFLYWLPVSNFFWYIAYPSADRYMYAPLIGASMLFVSFIDNYIKKKYIKYLVYVVICSSLFVLSFNQAKYWENIYSLTARMYDLYPNSEQVLVPLGSYYLRENRLNEAKFLFMKAIEKNPENSITYSYLGDVFIKSGEVEKAIEYYKKALRYDDVNAETMVNLGICYAKTGDITKGEDFIVEGLRKNEKLEVGYENLAYLYISTNRKNEAEAVYISGIKQIPHSHNLHFQFGKFLVSQGKDELALAILEVASKLTPDAPEPRREILQIAEQNGWKDIAAREEKILYHLEKMD